VKPVGEGFSELRIAYGPGYRAYYLQEGRRLIVLLAVATSPASRGTSRKPSG
jgi:putative addiction module killer protein